MSFLPMSSGVERLTDRSLRGHERNGIPQSEAVVRPKVVSFLMGGGLYTGFIVERE